MKHIYLAILLILMFYNCGGPKNFTYRYENKDTGLDKLIDINGYYVSQHKCDTAFYSIYMFYPNGLFTIVTTSQITPLLIDCFANGGQTKICKYPLWGTYRVDGDIIKTQVVRAEGNMCVIFRDYKILADKSIVNISDYVESEYTNLGYMKNYPSYTTNPCEKKAEFYSLDTKRDTIDCPFLKKKWFLNIKQ